MLFTCKPQLHSWKSQVCSFAFSNLAEGRAILGSITVILLSLHKHAVPRYHSAALSEIILSTCQRVRAQQGHPQQWASETPPLEAGSSSKDSLAHRYGSQACLYITISHLVFYPASRHEGIPRLPTITMPAQRILRAMGFGNSCLLLPIATAALQAQGPLHPFQAGNALSRSSSSPAHYQRVSAPLFSPPVSLMTVRGGCLANCLPTTVTIAKIFTQILPPLRQRRPGSPHNRSK
jgi:hypothetical protein